MQIAWVPKLDRYLDTEHYTTYWSLQSFKPYIASLQFRTYTKEVHESAIIGHCAWPSKGQIISECPLEILDFPKIWQISALESKKVVKS